MRAGLLAAVGVAAIALGGAALAQDAAQEAAGTSVPAGPVTNLRDSLVRTYDTNPTIMGQRQSLRQADENVAIARAQGRPLVTSTADYSRDVLTRNSGANGSAFTLTGRVSVPLYSGGTIRNSVRAANTRVEAGRADLRATEGDIFTEAVAAYMDVIRDRSIVELNRNQVRVLETNLQATRDRFEVGDLTRTDVAQSEARLALARSTLALAEGRLEASEENFRRVIGAEAGDLQPPNPLPTLPGTADQATQIALGNNADLASIAHQARAAGFDVRVAQGDRLPTISAVGSTTHVDLLGTANNGIPNGTNPDSFTNTGVGLSLSLPLYQGGAAGARVRRARAFETQLLEQAVAIERLVISNTRAAFASYQAALQAIE